MKNSETTNQLTKRELFCLKLGVPKTGDNELDNLILTSRMLNSAEDITRVSLNNLNDDGLKISLESIKEILKELEDVESTD